MINDNNVATSLVSIMQCTVKIAEALQTKNDDDSINSSIVVLCQVNPEVAPVTGFMILITDNPNPDVNKNWIWQVVCTTDDINSGRGQKQPKPGYYSVVFDLCLTPELASKRTLAAHVYALNAKGLSRPFETEFFVAKHIQK